MSRRVVKRAYKYRFYPTPQQAGLLNRTWSCAACGARHDRDVNAAKVLCAAGLAVQACGDGVRPPRT